MICEVLSDAVGEELRSLLAPLGYRFHHLTDRGPAHSEEIRAHPVWLNWLFSRMPDEEIARLG